MIIKNTLSIIMILLWRFFGRPWYYLVELVWVFRSNRLIHLVQALDVFRVSEQTGLLVSNDNKALDVQHHLHVQQLRN